MIGNMQSPFMWGSKGQKLTPDQVERERDRADALLQGVGDTSPVAHWLQGAGRVVNAITGKIQDRRAGASEQLGMDSADAYVANNPVLASLIGSGGSGVSMGVPQGAMQPQASSAPLDAMQSTGGGFGLRDGIIATAEAIGADPLDLATAISYETAGTFDPTKAGPTTQWGQHRGLIQFGEPQAEQYGVDFSNSDAALASQLGPDGAIAKYFTGSGFQPGMSGLDLYSTINAGAPGKYNASDANNGGAPGSVADKWNNQMSDHRAKAAELLGGSYSPSQAPQGGAQPQNNAGVIQALSGAMSDPWVAKKYGPVIEALMGQQMKRGDMQYQQQLAQSDPMYQAQLANATRPEPIDPWAGTQVINGQVVRMGANGPEAIGDFNTPEPGYQMVSPDEAAQLGLPPGAYQRGADGKISAVGGGGVTVNNDMSGGKFEEAFAKGDAAALGTISESGIAAQRNLSRIDQLEGLLSQSPSGFTAIAKQALGERGINTEGLSEIQAAQALINSLVPEQRQPGSGPMSDADLALFKQSLPRIINQKGGNDQIIQTMRAIAQYDAEGSQIVQRLRAGEIDRAQAFAALQGRENPLSGFKAPEEAPYANFGAALQGPASGGASTYRYNPETGKIEAVQ